MTLNYIYLLFCVFLLVPHLSQLNKIQTQTEAQTLTCYTEPSTHFMHCIHEEKMTAVNDHLQGMAIQIWNHNLHSYSIRHKNLQNFKTQHFLLYCHVTELIAIGVSAGYLDGHLTIY